MVFVVCVVDMAVFNRGPYRGILKYYLPKGASVARHVSIVWRLKTFIISLGFILAIALGMTVDDMYLFLGYSVA